MATKTIRLLESVVGNDPGGAYFSHAKGEVVTVPAARANDLVGGGHAEFVSVAATGQERPEDRAAMPEKKGFKGKK
jgi:hypothetical protein